MNAFQARLDEAGVGQVRIPRPPERSVIYAADGSVLATVYLNENRRIVQLENVAPVAQEAVLAIEDDGFYEHGALDFPGLIRAALKDTRVRRDRAGGVDDHAAAGQERAHRRAEPDLRAQVPGGRARDPRRAPSTPRTRSSSMYLNEVYFGNGAYGIGTASQTYFRKPPRSSRSPRPPCSRR